MNSKNRPMNKSDCTVFFLNEVILPCFGLECSSTNSCSSTMRAKLPKWLEELGEGKGRNLLVRLCYWKICKVEPFIVLNLSHVLNVSKYSS